MEDHWFWEPVPTGKCGFESRHPYMSQNYIGFYDLEVVQVADGVSAWRVHCHRCGLKAQTSIDGPDYKSAPDLTMLINRHVCDPEKRGQKTNGV